MGEGKQSGAVYCWVAQNNQTVNKGLVLYELEVLIFEYEKKKKK